MDISNNVFMSNFASDLYTNNMQSSASISAIKKANNVQEDMFDGIMQMNDTVDKSAVKSLVAEITGKGTNLDTFA